MPRSKPRAKRKYLNPRILHKKLLDAVYDMDRARDPVENVGRLLRALVEEPVIPVIGGRIWLREGDAYRLIDRCGGRKEIPPDYRIPADEGVLQRVRELGSCFVEASDSAYNRKLETDLGVQDYAAIAFGPEGHYVLSLDVTATRFEDRQEIVNFLAILRHSVDQRLERDHIDSMILEARDVQTSILPREMPSFRDYDIFGKSLPAEKEKVGGDLFDLIQVHDEDLAVVIADASGQGLPAALMARDVRTAVHMAVIGEIKVTRMVRRINRLIHEQAPSGRFISMFYGEIDRIDQIMYAAAGHPGLLLREDGFRWLREGGPVLGIDPEARYVRGGTILRPDDLLCLYTDGLSEARSPMGDRFGDERIRELLESLRTMPAREIVETVFAEVRRFSGEVQEDDQTMLIVKRGGGGGGDGGGGSAARPRKRGA